MNVLIIKVPPNYPSDQLERLASNLSVAKEGFDLSIVLHDSNVTDIVVEQLVPTVTLEQLDELLAKHKETR